MLRYSWQKNGAGSLSLKVVTLDLVQQMKYFSVEMVVRHSSFRRTPKLVWYLYTTVSLILQITGDAYIYWYMDGKNYTAL